MSVKIFDAPYHGDFKASSFLSDNGKGSMFSGEYFFTSQKGSWYGSDWLIVCDSSHSCFYTDIPRERRILFFGEPPEIREYAKYSYYIEQFGTIVSMSEIPGYTGRVIISNPKLGWTAGISGEMDSFSKAMNYPLPNKTRIISTVTSLRHSTEYHRKRVKFIRELQREFPGIIDCYGREYNPVDDKLSAIAPYKYHVAIENSRHKNYWTEKLTDAWAGWSLPIYFGDPEILNHVPDKRGLEVIDIDDMAGAVGKIRGIIESDIYSARIDAIRTCREWALKESNRYLTACEIVSESQSVAPKLIRPELFRTLISKRKHEIYKLLKKLSPNLADKVLELYFRKKGRFWE